MALNNLSKIADILGYKEDKDDFDIRLYDLNINFNKLLWTKDGYKMPEYNGIDERVNAIAVISGLADSDKYPVIKKLLTSNYDSSTYMEKYILEALCEMGEIEEAR